MKVKMQCGGCLTEVKVDLDAQTVTARIPSNGKRGAGHVPAHDAVTEGHSDEDLMYWECPACGYADSTYTDAETRKALS